MSMIHVAAQTGFGTDRFRHRQVSAQTGFGTDRFRHRQVSAQTGFGYKSMRVISSTKLLVMETSKYTNHIETRVIVKVLCLIGTS